MATWTPPQGCRPPCPPPAGPVATVGDRPTETAFPWHCLMSHVLLVAITISVFRCAPACFAIALPVCRNFSVG